MSDNPAKVTGRGRWQFFDNIFQLSETKDPDKLYEEWRCYGKVEYPEFDGHCVCNMSKVKHAHRFYNILTGRVCITGGECAKKLKLLTESKGTNRYLADFLNGSYPSEYTTIEDIYAYSVKQRGDWMKSVLKEIDTDLYRKTLKEIQGLLTELKEFQSILQRNGVSDPTLNGMVQRLQELERGRIQYKEAMERSALERRQEEEKRGKEAAVMRETSSLYSANRRLASEPIVFETKKRKEVDIRFLEIERKEQEERLRLKEEERMRHAGEIRLSLTERNDVMAMIMGPSNTS